MPNRIGNVDPATGVGIFLYVIFSVIVAYYAMRIAQEHRLNKERRKRS